MCIADHCSIIMQYDKQHYFIWPLYLPRLSDWVAFVGVLLVFILFRAPLTISEIWDKPSHINSIYGLCSWILSGQFEIWVKSSAYCSFHQINKSDDLILPPKLRLCLFFITELKSGSSSSSWVGDRTPASQPIMAGTLSNRNCGNTPVTHRDSQIFSAKKLQCRLTHRWPPGTMPQDIPKLWAFSMKQCTMAACSLRRFSVLAFIFSVPSPEWRRLGAKITDKLLLSILFSALLWLSKKKNSNNIWGHV